ncbi:general substrate transporter [Dacryopinax primogenitus]|uniref:General substrate transporter n=1 Tax=Dacryopinax primogenitus (strain DJM 731) TaxID=1858805 RepID=M5G8J6_DACPD|nr:general substrate transporter [Dacryopinax primogenitus]EJU00088.1 general substrate transporter [Dacryopinax primogenitus]
MTSSLSIPTPNSTDSDASHSSHSLLQPTRSQLLSPEREVEVEVEVEVDGEEKVTWFVWLLVGAAAIGGLLFGYDTGVISGALVSIAGDLGPAELSAFQKELITSSTTLGALLGGLAAGIISDYTGRKPVLFLANITFISGALGQSLSHTLSGMVGSRFLVGLGVGLAACIVPLYIGELAPTRLRGRLVTVNVIAITFGQVVAYAIGAAFEQVPGGWRWMVGLGAVPAGVQLACLSFLPESPRILIRNDNLPDARRVLRSIYAQATDAQVDKMLQNMCASVHESVALSKQDTLFEKLKSMSTVPERRRALIVACGLQAFQQLCGFNTLMYYSASLFKAVGFDQPTAVGLIIAGTNFLFTLVALKWIDRVGRRRIMLLSSPWMVLGLVLAAVSFYFMTKSTGGYLDPNAQYSKTWSALVLFSMIIYVAAYATGLGNVPWQQGELFSLEVRGLGSSLATATNWSANLLIGATYLSLLEAITTAGTFGLYAGLCALGVVFVYLCYPETAGLSLEEVRTVFARGFGVRESRMLGREKRERREREGLGI